MTPKTGISEISEITYTNKNKIKIKKDIEHTTSATKVYFSDEIVLDKIEKIKAWVRNSRDSEGLVSASKLNKKIREFGLDPKIINQQLLLEGFLFDSPVLGAWGVAK